MKWIIPCLWVFLPNSGLAQYDSLLNRSFNERFPVLVRHFEALKNKGDSISLEKEWQAMASFARTRGNQHWLAELDALQFRFAGARAKPAQALAGLSRATQLHYPQAITIHELYLAEYYWNQNDYQNAIQHYDKAFNTAEPLKPADFYLKQEVANRIGSRYYVLADYPTAIHYLQQALRSENPLDSIHPRIGIYNTLGLSCLNLGQLEAAKSHFYQALHLAEKVDNPVWIGNISGNLGHIFILQGDLEKGESLLVKDKMINLNRGAKGPAIGAMLELSGLYFKQGKIQEAIAQKDSALLLMGGQAPFNRKKVLFPLLSKINSYQGNWEMAALYLDSTLLIRDSLSRVDNAAQVLRLKQMMELHASREQIAEREASIRRKNQQLYLVVTGLLATLLGVFLVFRQKKRADREKQRSEELLLNILPADVAGELKASGVSRARKFPETSVLFCDFKNFTTYAEDLDPEELVRILDHYFRAFDQLVGAYGLEKIKTVGDAYICAAGLPSPDPDHAIKLVKCALAIQEMMKESKDGWQLRIGIHSGPVVAGIVGIKKFAYDIWGDTVNIAARMEQNAEAGKVNVSQATYLLVKDHFRCSYRGRLEVKNKGEMDMYYVEEVS
ncbi:MAG: tetratricopeptide repeat protein [Saprospiraceae bacterium]|nr:tetratricopeptide repeat protein [Saprospiraceae bacterium]